MKDQNILSEKDLGILKRAKLYLAQAQEILEESNESYTARKVFIDRVYVKLNDVIKEINRIQEWVKDEKAPCPLITDDINAFDIWELKKR